MTIWRDCLGPGQWIFTFALAFSSFTASTHALTCSSEFRDQAYREEVKKQWGYLDVLKKEKDKEIKKKSRRLIREIEKHAYANGVFLEVDTINSAALLP